ncbi:antitoxin [Patulibacter sp. SYSU D01012]|uniref:antitoxin n=1 Tax=Patulibacter sp. SYSU D01012 TaxID=2817381 RepID=UPI001B300DF6|nr:antitoxin [Patulibacter sp. SYSU D01012]
MDFKKLADKAKGLAGQHGDKIDQAIDRSVAAVDKATKGKHSDKLTGGAEKLKQAVDRAGAPEGTTQATPSGAGGTTPPAPGGGSGTGPGAATPAPDVTPVAPPVPTEREASSTPVRDPDAPNKDEA